MTIKSIIVYQEQFRLDSKRKANVKVFKFNDSGEIYRLVITKIPINNIHEDKIIELCDTPYEVGTKLGIILYNLAHNNDNK